MTRVGIINMLKYRLIEIEYGVDYEKDPLRSTNAILKSTKDPIRHAELNKKFENKESELDEIADKLTITDINNRMLDNLLLKLNLNDG